jgi:hypothetical protein
MPKKRGKEGQPLATADEETEPGPGVTPLVT